MMLNRIQFFQYGDFCRIRIRNSWFRIRIFQKVRSMIFEKRTIFYKMFGKYLLPFDNIPVPFSITT
jgi:hypothetical protein